MTAVRAKALRVIVHGKVQGVWFRAGTQEQARALGLTGWVRNCDDGTVEAQLRGGDRALQQMLDWLHHGPPEARVEAVETERLPDDTTDNNTFEVLG